MTLRADHVTGAAFVAFCALVIALSGDLPFGQLSMPGAGFLPMILAVLLILFGALLILRAGESRPFAKVGWSDAPHAAMVVGISAAAIAAFLWLGFFVTNVLLIFALLFVIERRNPLRAGLYSLVVVGTTYVLFVYVLKSPLEAGVLGF